MCSIVYLVQKYVMYKNSVYSAGVCSVHYSAYSAEICVALGFMPSNYRQYVMLLD